MQLQYFLKKSSRARRITIRIGLDGKVGVVAPPWMAVPVIEDFVDKHRNWINEKVHKINLRPREIIELPFSVGKSFKIDKEKSRQLVNEKVKMFADVYGLTYGRICIRNQKSRWGSCSRRGNLNFNFKIYYLPEALQDYLVVHEICHLKEFNHSRNFWNMVSLQVPEYKNLSKRLKNIRFV